MPVYHSQHNVKMWIFSQNTIAGDLGVTPLIQFVHPVSPWNRPDTSRCGASMVITSTLVHTDIHHKQIKPLPFVYPHVQDLPDPRSLFQPKKAVEPTTEKQARSEGDDPSEEDNFAHMGFFSYYYWMFIRFAFEGTEKNMLLARLPVSQWFGRLAWTIVQGLAIGVVFGFPLWCLAIVILGPIYRMNNMGALWAPQVIKMVYGAILGWLTNPVIATLALGSQAEHHLVVVEHDAEGSVHDVEADAAGGQVHTPAVETIHEDEVLDSPRAPYAAGTTIRRAPSSPSRSFRLAVPGAGTGTGTPSGRSRANSAASSGSRSSARPPLTANVSSFRPLSPATPLRTDINRAEDAFGLGLSTGKAASLAPPLSTPLLVAGPARPRGATVSAAPPTERSYSYALGGTGGRAKRVRGQRSESVGAAPSVPALSLPGGASEMGVSRRGSEVGDRDVFGSLPSSAIRPSPSRQRVSSGMGTGSLGASFSRQRSAGRELGELDLSED